MLNTGDGVLGGVSAVPIAVGDALSDRSCAAMHAFGLEAMSIGCGGAVSFVIAVTRVVSAVATALVDGKLLLLLILEQLLPPSTFATVATPGVE